MSLEMMKRMRIFHETFGLQTIDNLLFNQHTLGNKYSEKYNCNNIQFYQPAKSEIKEPSREENELRDKLIRKYSDTFVDKLGKEDRISVPPIKSEIDKR